jgi:hypothetical protein
MYILLMVPITFHSFGSFGGFSCDMHVSMLQYDISRAAVGACHWKLQRSLVRPRGDDDVSG